MIHSDEAHNALPFNRNRLVKRSQFLYNEGLALKSWPRLSGSKRKQEHESGHSKVT